MGCDGGEEESINAGILHGGSGGRQRRADAADGYSIEASSQPATQSFVDVAALSDYQNQDYQPAAINHVADSPVSNSNAPNFVGGTEFLRLRRVWIFCKSVKGLR